MINVSKKQENELEATTSGRKPQVSKLQQNVNKLKEMVNNSENVLGSSWMKLPFTR